MSSTARTPATTTATTTTTTREPARRAPFGATAILLLVAGTALALAAAIRWLPCITDLDSLTCVAAQDHLRDYGIVSAPFEPIVGAVVLAALASFVMAGFWLLWADWATHQPRTARLRTARGACIIAAAASAVIGGGQLLAALTDAALGVLGWVAASVVGLIALLAPIVASVAMLALTPTKRGRLAWAALIAGFCVGSQMAEFVILSNLFLASHDSPIGTGYVPAAALLVAGGVFGIAVTAAPGTRRGAPLISSVVNPDLS